MTRQNVSPSRVYTVSELNSEIKRLLELKFPFVWVMGQVSNFKIPSSGHFYFTLKDDRSQINAVMFHGQNRTLAFHPEDGMNLTGFGRISLYEPRGTYQIILEYLEPKGIGALQIAFEKLKAQLSAEGLFNGDRKKPIPFLPKTICLITSPTGAVIHDMINIIHRRYPGMAIEIIPVQVQGESAQREIVSAIEVLNLRRKANVAILARGGGSLEDLQAFNSEAVARAISNSDIPIIAAIGHETDYTIADFVADLRAPTPSAAAELSTPLRDELKRRTDELRWKAYRAVRGLISQHASIVAETRKRLADPRRKVHDLRLRMDECDIRLSRMMSRILVQTRQRLAWMSDKLFYNNPAGYIELYQVKIKELHKRFLRDFLAAIDCKHQAHRELMAKLNSLSPMAVLTRGYSITRTIPGAQVVRHAAGVSPGQQLQVLLSRGSITCRVEERTTDAGKDF